MKNMDKSLVIMHKPVTESLSLQVLGIFFFFYFFLLLPYLHSIYVYELQYIAFYDDDESDEIMCRCSRMLEPGDVF